MCIRSSAEYSASSCSIVLSYALTGIGEKAIVSRAKTRSGSMMMDLGI